jgi:anthranilate phosphoribosyltransferase
MNAKKAHSKVAKRGDLSEVEAEELFKLLIVDENIPESLVGGILTAFRMKGESASEIIGLVGAIRSLGGYPMKNTNEHLMDICGTGSDGASTVNISTACAFVLAAAKGCLPVAKHCGGSSSGGSGSLNVLQELGVVIATRREEAETHLKEHHVCFLDASAFHPILKRIGGIRKQLGIGTIFNLAMPFCNPLGPRTQLIGIAGENMLDLIGATGGLMGNLQTVAMHDSTGTDEAIPGGWTHANRYTYKGGLIRADVGGYGHHWYDDRYGAAGLSKVDPVELRVANAFESAHRIRAFLDGEMGALRDTVLLNAGIALCVGGAVAASHEGVQYARELIDGGLAKEVFESMLK